MKKVMFHEKAHLKGIGKPGPLKYQWKGYWSRRLNDEHRLIYKMDNDVIVVASLKGHYD